MNLYNTTINGTPYTFYGTSPRMVNHCIINIIQKDTYSIKNIPTSIDNVIDIGSCFGIFSYQARNLFPMAKIVAIEPTPSSFKCAKENLKNSNVLIYNTAIYNESGKEIHIMGGDKQRKNPGGNRIEEGNSNNFMCYSKTIEEVIAENEINLCNNTLLKLDCEGGEFFVIDKPNLYKKFYQISMEYHPFNDDHIDIFKSFLSTIISTHDIIKNGKTDRRSDWIFRRKNA